LDLGALLEGPISTGQNLLRRAIYDYLEGLERCSGRVYLILI
jgi:hypothetical protein